MICASLIVFMAAIVLSPRKGDRLYDSSLHSCIAVIGLVSFLVFVVSAVGYALRNLP